MGYSDPQKARRALFESGWFSKEISTSIEIDAGRTANACAALLATGLIPCASVDNADALATEGAMLLMAVGGRQTQPDAMARVLARLSNMTHQFDVVPGNSASGEGGPKKEAADLFGQGLEDVLRQAWNIARAPVFQKIRTVNISMFWGDERGSVLYGVIDHMTERRKQVYSTVHLPVPHEISEHWDFVQLPTVGGSTFSPMSIRRFAASLDDGVTGTPAELGIGRD